MAIDLGNNPVGSVPTAEQCEQIRASLDIFPTPVAVGEAVVNGAFSTVDYDIFGSMAFAKDPDSITSLSVNYVDYFGAATYNLNALKNLTSATIETGYVETESLIINVAGHKNIQTLNTLCAYQSMSSLDLSGCSSLTTLNTFYTWDLSDINFSGCVSLTDVNIGGGYFYSGLDFTDCLALETLNFGTVQFNGLNCTNLQNLTYITAFNSTANGMIQLSGCSSLTSVGFYDATNITEIDITGCVSLDSLQAYGTYDSAVVNDILIKLDDYGLEDGYVDITSGMGAPPTGDGITAAANLVTKGWTVITS